MERRPFYRRKGVRGRLPDGPGTDDQRPRSPGDWVPAARRCAPGPCPSYNYFPIIIVTAEHYGDRLQRPLAYGFPGSPILAENWKYSKNSKTCYFWYMPKNTDPSKPKGKPGRKPGSKDKFPRQVRGIGGGKSSRQDTKSPKAAVVPAWVKGKGLRPKHALFVAEFMVDKNAKQAALRAGYSPSVAANMGNQLLNYRPDTKEAIAQALEAQQVRTGITADRVLQELANIAFGKPTAVMTWGPDGVILRDSETMAPGDIALVSEVSETKGTDKGGGSMKVKLHDKMKALELIGRTLGIFQDVSKVQVQNVDNASKEVKDDFETLMSKAQERWKSQGYHCAPGKR